MPHLQSYPSQPWRQATLLPSKLQTCCHGKAWRRLAWAGLLLALAGCQDDGIQHYQVPKPPVYRLLGAIAPHGPNLWFFKLSGPDAAVQQHKPEFDRFIESVTFSAADQPPSWKLPEGWRQEPSDQMRFATLRLGPGEDALELTVTRLGREASGKPDAALLANVNRWRAQMGVPEVEADRLAEIARPRDVHGVTLYTVDMTGPKPGKTSRGMSMPARPPVAKGPAPGGERPEQSGLHYTTPPGWKEPAQRKAMRAAEFEIEEEGKRAEVTVIPLGGAAGSLLDNVNRWRSQVGLAPVGDDQLRRDAVPVAVGGGPGSYLDLAGPEGQRILVVMVPRGDQTWFFKMTGPAGLVGRQKAAFEAFVQSVRFE
jgi:hypothetical protein